MYTPFPSQQREIEKIVKFIDSKTAKKGIFAMPVAFGKSIVIANLAMRYPEKYFINTAPSKELVKQNYEKYISYGYEASLCSASLNSNEVSKVTFATIGTLIKHAEFFKNKEVVLLNDEAHEGSLRGGQLDKFVKKLKKCKVVGVTATPMRLNPTSGGARLSMMNRQFKCIYSTLESVVQVADVIAEGRWSKLIYNVENVDETKLELNTTGSDYTLESLAAFSDANNIKQKCVEAVYRLREEGRKSCIVYVTSIEEAEAVASKIDNAAVLHSKLRTVVRDRVIREFTSGRLQTVVNVGILKQGFDYPLLSSIVLARPTNSYTMYYQILGRAIRIHKDKEDAKIVDISGNYNKFGAIEDLEFLNADYAGGWAAFSGDRLLTDYALGGSLVPTKQSLKDHYKEFTNPSAFPKDPEFTFGKHKGTKVSIVKRNHEGYLFWMVDPKTEFKFGGKNGAELKAAIYRVLKLPFGVPVKNKDPF